MTRNSKCQDVSGTKEADTQADYKKVSEVYFTAVGLIQRWNSGKKQGESKSLTNVIQTDISNALFFLQASRMGPAHRRGAVNNRWVYLQAEWPEGENTRVFPGKWWGEASAGDTGRLSDEILPEGEHKEAGKGMALWGKIPWGDTVEDKVTQVNDKLRDWKTLPCRCYAPAKTRMPSEPFKPQELIRWTSLGLLTPDT